MPEKRKERYLNLTEMAAYSVSGFGIRAIVGVINYLLTAVQIPYLYNIDILHGTIIFCIVSVLNVLVQPLFGTLLENTHTKSGQYKPYVLYLTPVISMFVVLATWLPQTDSTSFRVFFAYATCIPTLLLWNLWYNTSQMLPGVMTPVSQERTNLLAYSGIFTGLSATIVNMAAGPLRAAFMAKGKEYLAFRILGIASVVVGLLTISAILKIKERIRLTPHQKEEVGIREGLRLILKNKPMLILTAACILGCLRTVADLNLIYAGQFRYGTTTEEGLRLFSIADTLASFGGTAASLILPHMTKRMEKKTIMILWQVINSGSYLLLFLIGYQRIPVGMASVAVLSVFRFFTSFNGSVVLLPVMLSEIYDYQQWKTGRRLEGVIQTLAVALVNMVTQFAMFLPALLQKAMGFQPMLFKNGAEYLPQNTQIITRWLNTAAGISAISGFLFIAVMFFYPLTNKKYASVMEDLWSSEKPRGDAND